MGCGQVDKRPAERAMPLANTIPDVLTNSEFQLCRYLAAPDRAALHAATAHQHPVLFLHTFDAERYLKHTGAWRL